MGFWDIINSVGDQVKGITPDLSTMKRAAYNHTSASVTKSDQLVSTQKLPEYLPDPKTSAQIGTATEQKMGFWDLINSVGDQVKGITPDLSTVKRAAYNHTSAAVTKIDQVVSIQKLPEYLPDPETRAQIGVFTATLAKNTGKYAVYEGFKHIPGGNVVHKLILDTVREVQQENQGDGMKAMEEKVERSEKDLTKLNLTEMKNE